MKAQLLAMLVGAILKMLTPELMKNFLDLTLDFVEQKVQGTQSTVDDAVVLPICNMIRLSFDVPDDDLPNLRHTRDCD